MQEDVDGFDDRLLIKIQLREGATVPDLNAIPGVEIVSQEDKSVVLAFADQAGRAEFESRLSTLARDGRATRVDLLYALQSFDHWTPDDRTGPALRQHGFPPAIRLSWMSSCGRKSAPTSAMRCLRLFLLG